MSRTIEFISNLEIAKYHLTSRHPNINAARYLLQGAKSISQELTQELVPSEWRGIAVGGVLNYIETIARFAPDRQLAYLRNVHEGDTISVHSITQDIQRLSTDRNIQLLEVLFLERDPNDSPLRRISEELRYLEPVMTTINIITGFMPIVGSIFGLYELYTEQNLITGQRLSTFEKSLITIGVILEGLGPALRTLSRVTRNSQRITAIRRLAEHHLLANISRQEAVNIVRGLDLLSEADWAKIQRISELIRSGGRITRKDELLMNYLISKYRVLARVSNNIDEIARTNRGNPNASGFFDFGERAVSGTAQRIRNLQNEIRAGQLLVSMGRFRQILRLGGQENIVNLIRREIPNFDTLPETIRRALTNDFAKKMVNPDFLVDQSLLVDVITLESRTGSNRILRAIESISEKLRQGNGIVVINDISAFNQREIIEISTRLWGSVRNHGNIIWLNLRNNEIISEFAKPDSLDRLNMLQQMVSNGVAGLVRTYRSISAQDE